MTKYLKIITCGVSIGLIIGSFYILSNQMDWALIHANNAIVLSKNTINTVEYQAIYQTKFQMYKDMTYMLFVLGAIGIFRALDFSDRAR